MHAPVTNALELSLRRTRREAEEPKESSQVVQESAASTALPLRALPDSMKRLRYGRSIPEGRTASEDSIASMLDCARSSEYSITQRGHELVGSSPLLGLSGPDARPNVLWSPAEASAVDAQHRASAPEATEIQLMAPTGGRTSQTKSDNLSYDHHGDNLRKQDSCRDETCRSNRTAQKWNRGRRGQSSRAKPRLGSGSS